MKPAAAVARRRPEAIAPFIEDEFDVLFFQPRHLFDILVPCLKGFADAVGQPPGSELQRIVDIHK